MPYPKEIAEKNFIEVVETTLAACLARDLLYFPSLAKGIEKIYLKNKNDYYSFACNTFCYDFMPFSSWRISDMVLAKRLYSVLLSECKHNSKTEACALIIDSIPEFRTIWQIINESSVSIELLQSLSNQFYDREFKKSRNVSREFFNNAFVFLIYIQGQGLKEYETIVEDVMSFACSIAKTFSKQTLSEKSRIKIVDSVPKIIFDASNTFKTGNSINSSIEEGMNLFFEMKKRTDDKMIDSIQDAQDYLDDFFSSAADESSLYFCRDRKTHKQVHELFSKNYSNDKADTLRCLRYSYIIHFLAKEHNIEIGSYLRDGKVDEATRKFLVSLCSLNYSVNIDVGNNAPIPMSDYYIITFLEMIFSSISEDRDYQVSHGEESVFDELNYLKGVISALERTISELNNVHEADVREKESLISRIESFEKDEKDEIAPYKKEINELQKKLSQYEAKMAEYKNNEKELSSLRDFVFSLDSTDISIEKYNVENLIADKKLAIVGGHENWRNKVKQEHPSFDIYDGFLNTQDFSSLVNKDVVLLYTTYMSHSTYFKAMDVIKRNDIPFGIIGKSNNAELYDIEIAEVLTKLFGSGE